jgi:hypothetical protein
MLSAQSSSKPNSYVVDTCPTDHLLIHSLPLSLLINTMRSTRLPTALLFTTFLSLAISTPLCTHQTNITSSSNTTCTTGIHMIIARASTEHPGPGIIAAVATSVQNSLPGSDSEAVVYPATLTDYLNSEASGVAAMKDLVTSYAERCPESKIALLGYSQGAQVIGDVVCGTSEANLNSTPALSSAQTKNSTSLLRLPFFSSYILVLGQESTDTSQS